nr:MAG TPA: hypothetical protein [Caudoviricetes sp.]
MEKKFKFYLKNSLNTLKMNDVELISTPSGIIS